MIKTLEQYLRKHRLVQPGERVGVAVSGGADSVALLRALVELAPELGIVPFVLHLNHNLRGAESEGDASFVRELAARLGLECEVESVDVAALAARMHLSLEAAGRRARYEFFRRAAANLRLDCVATAHTRDDQAETVLLRLLRGTGISGLAGIHRGFDLCDVGGPANDAEAAVDEEPAAAFSALLPDRTERPDAPRLIRPLLTISRIYVERYLAACGQSFRTDGSNLSPQFLRNRVRAELLPALESNYNPRLREALCETAEIAAAENDFFETLVTHALGQARDPKGGIELKRIQAQPLAMQRRMLRRMCQAHLLALDFAQLEGLREFALAGRAGRLQLPRGFAAEITRPKLLPARLSLLAP